jgi:hypothetical protein
MSDDYLTRLYLAHEHAKECVRSLRKAGSVLGVDLDDEPEMDDPQAEDAEPLMPGAPRLPDNSDERRARLRIVKGFPL